MREKGVAHIILMGLLAAGLIAGVYLVQQTQIFKPKAFSIDDGWSCGGYIDGPCPPGSSTEDNKCEEKESWANMTKRIQHRDCVKIPSPTGNDKCTYSGQQAAEDCEIDSNGNKTGYRYAYTCVEPYEAGGEWGKKDRYKSPDTDCGYSKPTEDCIGPYRGECKQNSCPNVYIRTDQEKTQCVSSGSDWLGNLHKCCIPGSSNPTEPTLIPTPTLEECNGYRRSVWEWDSSTGYCTLKRIEATSDGAGGTACIYKPVEGNSFFETQATCDGKNTYGSTAPLGTTENCAFAGNDCNNEFPDTGGYCYKNEFPDQGGEFYQCVANSSAPAQEPTTVPSNNTEPVKACGDRELNEYWEECNGCELRAVTCATADGYRDWSVKENDSPTCGCGNTESAPAEEQPAEESPDEWWEFWE